MFNTLMRMWKKGMLTEEKLQKAVDLGWITEAEAEIIRNTPR